MAFTIAIYAIIGYLSRTTASRCLLCSWTTSTNCISTEWLQLLTGCQELLSLQWQEVFTLKGYGYMALLVGWTGGYVLSCISISSIFKKIWLLYSSRFRIGTRYGGNLARFCAVIVLTVASFTYVTAQINATGTIASVALDIDF